MGDMSREPSMEDILSSIRRVIARDEATVQTRMSRVPTVEEVLELADRPKEKRPDPISEAPAAFAETPPPQADLPRGFAEAPRGFAHAPEPPPVEFHDDLAETLVSNASAEATRQSLDALNKCPRKQKTKEKS